MSLFDNIKSFAQNLVGPKVSNAIYTGANAALTVLTKPIQSITGRFDKAYETTAKQGLPSLEAQGISNALMVSAPFVAPVRTAIVSTVSKLSPVTKLVGGLGAIFGTSYLASHPSNIPEPSGLAGAGADFPTEPSFQTGIEYVKTHPYVSAAGATAALASLGFGTYTIANLLSNYNNTQAVKDNTKATMDANNPTNITNSQPISDYKDQIKIIEAQTKAQESLNKQAFDYQKELSSLPIAPTPAAVVAPTPLVAPVAGGAKKKKKAKKKAKKKKKTRRSKEKAKKKTIKRRKHKK